ncbi:MAG: ECF transporter S component [Clostridia bacterium]|nr:ECF transporter S component [Clostridia bacterium]
MKNKMTTDMIAKMGMMIAVALVLGFIRFPIIPAVGFLTYDFADIPILITAFAYGPIPGLIVTVLVCFIQAFMLGGDGIYGFLMHFLASGAFVLVAATFYQRKKTKKQAVVALILASIVMIVLMAVANIYITPFYMAAGVDGGIQAVKQMVFQLMPLIVLFNVIKAALNSGITFVVYKKISGFLHREGIRKR